MKNPQKIKSSGSSQLFHFCYKILTDKKGKKIHDQEIGSILNFNPSDCSHWKRGEKHIKSISMFNTLAKKLDVETTLLHDLASGNINLEEAYYEHKTSHLINNTLKYINSYHDQEEILARYLSIKKLTDTIHIKMNFKNPPVYLPELFHVFENINQQSIEIISDLSRILKVKSNHYTIQFKKTDMKSQTRMSIIHDLAKIILKTKRDDFNYLLNFKDDIITFEELCFVANIMIPLTNLREEIKNVNIKKNSISELNTSFWAPKTLINFQIHQFFMFNIRPNQNLYKEVINNKAIHNSP